MKKRFNPQLLKEELKKFKLLSEYDFYQEKKEMPEYKDLLLGTELEEDEEATEEPNDLQPEDDVDSAAGNIAADLGVDGDLPQGGEESNEEPTPDMEVDEPIEEPSGDEVEVDVTSLVKGSEEAKEAADAASKNTEMLLNKLADLESRIANMVKITDKIEGLEKEIIKRNPTPVEKLEMRSLSSAPFNQKLTDYWADKEGAYDVMGNEKKPKEYVLTKDDVDSTYSDVGISKTFSTQENLYEEENIKGYEEEDI
jgi:hypothetical protein